MPRLDVNRSSCQLLVPLALTLPQAEFWPRGNEANPPGSPSGPPRAMGWNHLWVPPPSPVSAATREPPGRPSLYVQPTAHPTAPAPPHSSALYGPSRAGRGGTRGPAPPRPQPAPRAAPPAGGAEQRRRSCSCPAPAQVRAVPSGRTCPRPRAAAGRGGTGRPRRSGREGCGARPGGSSGKVCGARGRSRGAPTALLQPGEREEPRDLRGKRSASRVPVPYGAFPGGRRGPIPSAALGGCGDRSRDPSRAVTGLCSFLPGASVPRVLLTAGAQTEMRA